MSVLRATVHLSLLAIVASTRALADTTTAIALHLLDDEPAAAPVRLGAAG